MKAVGLLGKVSPPRQGCWHCKSHWIAHCEPGRQSLRVSASCKTSYRDAKRRHMSTSWAIGVGLVLILFLPLYLLVRKPVKCTSCGGRRHAIHCGALSHQPRRDVRLPLTRYHDAQRNLAARVLT